MHAIARPHSPNNSLTHHQLRAPRDGPSSSVSVASSSCPSCDSNMYPEQDINEWMDIKVVEVGEYVAGGHSNVLKAEVTRNGDIVAVALKVLRPFGKRPEVFQLLFEREVTNWKKLVHRNIAPLYGAYPCWNGLPTMVLPWYPHGTAAEYLHQHPDADHISIITGVASALAYMHSRCMVHGDVKAANVMIDEDHQARVIDFGLSHSMDETLDAGEDTCVLEGFSMRWCAPELLSPGAVSTLPSDVYAFASTVVELLSGELPHKSVPETLLFNEVRSGRAPWELSGDLFLLLLRRSGDISRALRLLVLLTSCWGEAPLRPSMRQLQRALKRIYS